MRRLALVAAVAVVLVACGGGSPSPVAEQTPTAPTTTRPDPGVAACKTVARRAAAGVAPTDRQRAAAWKQLQGSRHDDLQAVGVKLQRAWTQGGLADQVEANTNAAMACAAHGVEVKLAQS
jgi:PBP1b-binding outer membrane lipoprotein LpoB